MFKKPVVASLILITIGIIVGSLIVSNFTGGVSPGWAGGGDVQLGGPPPVVNTQTDLGSLNSAFVQVAKAVTPSIVAITVTTKEKSGGNEPRVISFISSALISGSPSRDRPREPVRASF